MNMHAGDIENEDDDMVEQEEEDSNALERRGETQVTSTNEAARDPIIINR